MPDIAMCVNKLCPSRYTCHRFTAIPNSYQSYGGFTVEKGKYFCDYYWDDSNYERREEFEINKDD